MGIDVSHYRTFHVSVDLYLLVFDDNYASTWEEEFWGLDTRTTSKAINLA